LVVLALAVASLAAAMPIVGLYGTGLSTTGTLVSGDAVRDRGQLVVLAVRSPVSA
jgi:hypothetical protein